MLFSSHRYNNADDDNFTQAGIFYREVLDEDARSRLVSNIVGHLKDAAVFIQVSKEKPLLFAVTCRQDQKVSEISGREK